MKNNRLFLASFALIALGCGSSGAESGATGGGCQGAKCDSTTDDEDIPAAICDGKLHDESGNGLGSGRIAGRLGDPLARQVFAPGDDCPTTFSAIVTKLGDSGACTNRQTRFVSETSSAEFKPDTYRSVTSLDCDDGSGGTSKVLFSLFGIDGRVADFPADVEIPETVEMIAFDSERGVFNYYKTTRDGQGLDFFGNSIDFLSGPGEGEERACAECHTGGGLIMKELDAPWVHWEGDFDLPGTAEILAANPLLGGFGDGIEMEEIVRETTTKWNQTRIQHVVDNLGETTSVQDLLRPVFCTVEVNLVSQFNKDVSQGPLAHIVVDGELSGFDSLLFEFEDHYLPLVAANNQRVEGLGVLERDVDGGLAAIRRGAADSDYQDRLIAEDLITREFAEDVRMVDFTRSVFSDDRCALLAFAPELDASSVGPGAIKDGFIERLESEADPTDLPAADLLRNLRSDDGDSVSRDELPRPEVSRFENACTGRTDEVAIDGATTVPGVLVDYVQYVSAVRRRTRELSVFEFAATMPTDDLDPPRELRLHPVTCKPVSEFVPVEPTSGGGD